MADFNFPTEGINTFDFGLTGDFTNFDFTIISDGSTEYNFEFGSGVYIYKIFRGSNNNFNSIWADPNASLTSGKFYAGREEDLSIVNNVNEQVYLVDYYSTTVKGSTEDTLTSEDIVDINVT